ncbi:putative UDP-Gal or UDP-GlcNAc-dependent glycosyltransferase [Trypanosoma cruzi]|uniref:Putative UDP-Gal or UDP-GlcNAc-dependent glycosyltransferase n=1 Tax=Trypanosoma cruzi TaxID=5693 RepID=A0A2V2V9V6_TRYCR|nr:putative UDP-Gal or UDP-GlcNAc-dependent glycosyltransferase [Trypanosoma cruzi]
MAKPKLLTLRQNLKRVTVLLILFIVATTVLTLRLDTTAYDDASGPNNPRHSRAAAADDAALAYISRRVLDTWSRREYLVVLGIPSTDDEARRTRRNLQRTSCWRFPGWRRGRTTSPVRCSCCTSLGDTRRTAMTTLPRCWRRRRSGRMWLRYQ